MKTRTVQLGVKDRLILIGLLPKEANFLEIKILQELKDDLAFDNSEMERLHVIQQNNGMIVWDQDAAKDCIKIVTMSEVTASLVVKALVSMDKQSKLTSDHIGLYEMFVVNAVTDADEIR